MEKSRLEKAAEIQMDFSLQKQLHNPRISRSRKLDIYDVLVNSNSLPEKLRVAYAEELGIRA